MGDTYRKDKQGNPQMRREKSARKTMKNRGRNIDAVVDAISNPRSSANKAGRK